jgi:succinate dehydrogenase / fumarate reductase iron-sulfur subunit
MAAGSRRGLRTFLRGGEIVRFTIKIRRQEKPDAAPFWQSFVVEGDGSATVASALCEINSRDSLYDENGDPASQIKWESGCLQRKCGACAMRINGTPRLACSTFLSGFPRRWIGLEPLGKFPVAADLIVDRSVMLERLKQARLWLEEKAFLSDARREPSFQSARRLMCGCCLEICPNFCAGGDFSGAALAVGAYRALEQSGYGEHRKEMAGQYKKQFFDGCGQSLSCQKICPAGLPVEDLIARSNAAAIWGK